MSHWSPRALAISVMAGAVVFAACASPQGSRATDRTEAEPVSRQPRTLVIATNIEVATLSPKVAGPTNPTRTTRIFNAGLALLDAREDARPYLAETLPQLNTESWRVSPDGRMETTYRLRPDLTWHDGAPLRAEDFLFGWRVYTHPGLGIFYPQPLERIEGVEAPDSLTVLVRWRTPYPEAGALVIQDLDPLPRHLLEAPFATFERDGETRDAFLAHRYWSDGFIGAGPYRLVRWDLGAQMEGVAFDAHVLGKPKIERLVLRFFGDENAVMTNVLAGEVHFTMQQSLRFEQAMFLRREWTSSGSGLVLLMPTSTSNVAFQHRAEYLQFPALRDVRVRRALVHAVDKQGLIDGLFEGQGPIVHTYIGSEQPYFPEIDRAVVKYPHDIRHAEQLLNDAGLSRDRDGFFGSGTGERFQPSFWVTGGTQTERLMALITNTWQQGGIDAQPYVIPVAQARDNQVRSTFPAMLNYGISTSPMGAFESFTSPQIGTAANRWGGQNRGGWANAEYDRLLEAYASTLERPVRIQRLGELVKLLSEEVPNVPLFSNLGAITHLTSLKGPELGTPDTTHEWNIQDWELR